MLACCIRHSTNVHVFGMLARYSSPSTLSRCDLLARSAAKKVHKEEIASARPSVSSLTLPVIRAAASSDAGRLAATIARKLRNCTEVLVQSKGDNAGYIVAKAGLFATLTAKSDLQRKQVALRPSLKEVEEGNVLLETQFFLQLQRVEVEITEDVSEDDRSAALLAGASTNVGRLAGAIASRLAKGEQDIIMQGIGPKSHSQAVKALIQAEDYLHKNGNTSARLAYLPTLVEEVGEYQNSTERRVVLRMQCFLV